MPGQSIAYLRVSSLDQNPGVPKTVMAHGLRVARQALHHALATMKASAH
jgi:hypothetical protein